MNNRYVVWLSALFVLLDVGYSYTQHLQLPLEGDIASIVLPGPWYSQVLQDPFGWAVLTKNAVYAGPNRYFAHAFMSGYMKYMPLWLQHFTDPISSIYVACALFKTVVQALLLYLLAVYCTGAQRLTDSKLWVVAALLVPLFQTGGYNEQMGIIELSITYTFFYAFPLALLLVLLLPFYRAVYRRRWLPSNWLSIGAWVGLMVVLALNGPVVTGAVIVLLGSVCLHWVRTRWQAAPSLVSGAWWYAQARKIPKQPLALAGLFLGLCLYSLYIGRNNAENLTHVLSVWERYKRLPSGMFQQLTGQLGFPLLIGACLLNAQLIRHFLPPTVANHRVLRMLQLLGFFAALYIVLLPLGGYRYYRPLLLRRDSILPIILGVVYFYGASAYQLLQQLPSRPRLWYIGGLVLMGGIFMSADKLQMLQNNSCERRALQQVAQSSEQIVYLRSTCTVMAWDKIATPQESVINAQLLNFWGVTNGTKLYYQSTATPSLHR